MVVLSDGFSETLADWENRQVSWFGSAHGAYKDRMIYPYLDAEEPFCWVSSVHLSGVVGIELLRTVRREC